MSKCKFRRKGIRPKTVCFESLSRTVVASFPITNLTSLTNLPNSTNIKTSPSLPQYPCDIDRDKARSNFRNFLLG